MVFSSKNHYHSIVVKILPSFRSNWLIVLVSLAIIMLVAHHVKGEVGLINNQAINK